MKWAIIIIIIIKMGWMGCFPEYGNLNTIFCFNQSLYLVSYLFTCMRFGVLMVVNIKITVFLDLMSCNLVDGYHCFRGTLLLLLLLLLSLLLRWAEWGVSQNMVILILHIYSWFSVFISLCILCVLSNLHIQ
jgi:hypothetical protein